jgi:hypothetical protein
MPVLTTKPGNLKIGLRVHEIRGAAEMAEERHVRHRHLAPSAPDPATANVMPPPWLEPVTAIRAASTAGWAFAAATARTPSR